MLILSFSEIVNDARVLKQIDLFKDTWDLTTCGYGPRPSGVAHHLQIQDKDISLNLDGRLITLKQYKLAFWQQSTVRAAWKLLKSYKGKFDLIIANEPDTVPLALKLKAAKGIHADLHEYTPSLHEHNDAWNRRIKPYFKWLIGKYAVKADAWSSPCDSVGYRHQEVFGFQPITVTNAAPFVNLEPTEVHRPIRFVHHGGAQRTRNPHVMVEGFMNSDVEGIFDLYLTGINPEVSEDLRDFAASDPRVNVYDGIPYDSLLKRLNDYDVGIHILPPINFNNKWALPNKLFDFIQARLGQIVSPNPEMAKVVKDFDLGVVTSGFEADELTSALESVTPEKIAEWKANANKYAFELSAETQVPKWAESIQELVNQ